MSNFICPRCNGIGWVHGELCFCVNGLPIKDTHLTITDHTELSVKELNKVLPEEAQIEDESHKQLVDKIKDGTLFDEQEREMIAAGEIEPEAPKYKLKYMLINSCYECNQRGVRGDGSEDICCITGTVITHYTRSEMDFPADCPLKDFEKQHFCKDCFHDTNNTLESDMICNRCKWQAPNDTDNWKDKSK